MIDVKKIEEKLYAADGPTENWLYYLQILLANYYNGGMWKARNLNRGAAIAHYKKEVAEDFFHEGSKLPPLPDWVVE